MRLIDIMIEFGLSFIQEKNEDGQFIFKLDPYVEEWGGFNFVTKTIFYFFSPVEQLLNFNLSAPKNVLPRQYAVRQMISHEVCTKDDLSLHRIKLLL